jgi:hypothetical protein
MRDDDLEILQELFDSEPAMKALGAPIGLRAAASAIRDLRSLASGEDGPAVAAAWNRLYGALGPRLTAALLSGPEWHSFCPISRPLDDYDNEDHSQVVWIGSAQRVVGRAVMDGEQFIGLKFTAEPR